MTDEHPLEYLDAVIRENRLLRSELAASLERIAELESLVWDTYSNIGEAMGSVWTESGLNGLEAPGVNKALMDCEERMAELGIRNDERKC